MSLSMLKVIVDKLEEWIQKIVTISSLKFSVKFSGYSYKILVTFIE